MSDLRTSGRPPTPTDSCVGAPIRSLTALISNRRKRHRSDVAFEFRARADEGIE
jgi:hypothetical protein